MLIVAIVRPKTATPSLILMYMSISVAEFVILTHSKSIIRLTNHVDILAFVVSIAANCVVLNMPLRPRELLVDDISQVGAIPTSELRSPEDNLTLWQFMTVSWMAPLLAIGKSRQLNGEDVWFLGYEFHHKRLHNAFRELQGSVIRRLLNANGIDLMIITGLGILELLASKSSPYSIARYSG